MARSDRTNQKGPSDESERRFQGISRKILSEQEREREWAAKKIHDNIIQILAAIKLSTAMALQELEKGHPGRVKRSLENSISMIQNAIEETRRIHAELRPSALDGLGILAAIRGFCREFQENYPAIRLHKRMEVEESEVPLPLKIVIYRIVQEAAANMERHSSACDGEISLVHMGKKLELAIRDHGRGFDLAKVFNRRDPPPTGFGLAVMKERTELSGGVLSVESTVGKGTTVRAVWPLRRPDPT
jgi:signal transduction histidine kinase